MKKASVIIPTYKRVELLNRVLNSLIAQDNIHEILVIDSNSADGTKSLVEKYNQNSVINIRHIDVDNNVSLKRNTGIKESSSNQLIFLDDDCIPDKYFVREHLNSMAKYPNDLHCGDIFFPKELVNTSNYIRYKDSRHIPYRYSKSNNLDLDFKSIVTMNMSINKDQILKNKLFFREDFIGYGMEDNEFGCQVIASNIKIKKSSASIQHIEGNDPFIFATKIFHTARDGVYKLKSVNNKAVMNLPYSYFFETDYVHKNILIKCFIISLRFLFTTKIAKYVLKVLNLTDRYKVLYFPILYKYVYASYYKKGVNNRKEAYKSSDEVINSWYTEDT
jgi:glycosyltransferase involved in cell wall biosynthesis